MKTKNIIRNGFLMALAACTVACNNAQEEAPTVEVPVKDAGTLKIAYVNIDTLTNQYELYKDASENFQKKQANAEATINEKGKSFAQQVDEFQRKVRSNSITQEQYESEQARLGKLQQDIQDLQGRLSNSLQEEYAKELQTLTDTIKSFMNTYAKQKGFDFILCKSSGIDNVLYANEMYDVTPEVVAALNKRYAKDAKKAKASGDKNEVKK